MVNYQNGKIYKIINENNEIIYIGSTTEEKLCRRYTHHTHKSPNHKIILIENYPCNSKEELRKREQEVIEEHSNLLNKQRAYRSKEDKKECDKKWCEKNKEHLKQYKKEYRENNQEYYKQYKKEYRENNKEYIKNYKSKWYENNKHMLKQKVVCEFCNTELNKGSLKRHHQKSKSCLKLRECLILDDE